MLNQVHLGFGRLRLDGARRRLKLRWRRRGRLGLGGLLCGWRRLGGGRLRRGGMNGGFLGGGLGGAGAGGGRRGGTWGSGRAGF